MMGCLMCFSDDQRIVRCTLCFYIHGITLLEYFVCYVPLPNRGVFVLLPYITYLGNTKKQQKRSNKQTIYPIISLFLKLHYLILEGLGLTF